MFLIAIIQLVLIKISIYYLNYIYKMFYQYSRTVSSTHLEKNLRFTLNETKTTRSLKKKSTFGLIRTILESLFDCTTPSPSPQPSSPQSTSFTTSPTPFPSPQPTKISAGTIHPTSLSTVGASSFSTSRPTPFPTVLHPTFFPSSRPTHSVEFLEKITADDGASGDRFGYSLSLSNDTVAVGSYLDDDKGAGSGSVYLFSSTNGSLIQKLTVDDGMASDNFGHSVSSSNDILAVGSPFDDDKGAGSGSVYLFSTEDGSLIQKLTADDGKTADQFGHTVSLSNDIVAVGSIKNDDKGIDSGSVYLFSTTDGSLIQKLTADDGASGDKFGYSLSLSNDILAVGSPFDNDKGFHSGSVYLFSTEDGLLIQKLAADDGTASDNFGHSVSLSNDILAVGSPFDDDKGAGSGSVYLFSTEDGSLIQKLTADDGAPFDNFGHTVSLSNDILAVGSPFDDDKGTGSGSVYLFSTTDGSLIQKITAEDGAAADRFGHSVSLSCDIVAVGSIKNDDKGPDSGSVYLFRTTFGASSCP